MRKTVVAISTANRQSNIPCPMSTCAGSSVGLGMVVQYEPYISYCTRLYVHTIGYHDTGPILISESIPKYIP